MKTNKEIDKQDLLNEIVSANREYEVLDSYDYDGVYKINNSEFELCFEGSIIFNDFKHLESKLKNKYDKKYIYLDIKNSFNSTKTIQISAKMADWILENSELFRAVKIWNGKYIVNDDNFKNYLLIFYRWKYLERKNIDNILNFVINKENQYKH